MAYVGVTPIKQAGDHLIDVLLDDLEVPYSRFYNADPQTAAGLNAACGFEPDDEQAHVYLEFAAQQLAAQGLVTFEELPDRLIDDEPNFRIKVTERLLELIIAGDWPQFRDMDL